VQLRVRLFAVLRERAGTSELELDSLPEDLDIGGLKRELVQRYPVFGDLSYAAGVIGDSYVPDSTALKAGDLVSLLPPVSGGAPEGSLEDGLFELSADPIDPGEIGSRVGHPGCGATVLFTGTTRDNHRGQTVVRLDYEAFHEMAGPEMRRIFTDCKEAWGTEAPGLRMICVHRHGAVEVGKPSVVVAVASAHRDAAFGAARFLIDTLKARLPVWKKEIYADGEHWVGDRP
jgi:molybdopterin synthase catalytic subunit/molybdopterin converting factor small subunit